MLTLIIGVIAGFFQHNFLNTAVKAYANVLGLDSVRGVFTHKRSILKHLRYFENISEQIIYLRAAAIGCKIGVISSVSGILTEGKAHVAKSNVIELNGKRYDAVTGNFLGDAPHTPSHSQTNKQPTGHRGRFIDGFVKPARHANTNTAQGTAFIPVHPAPKPSHKPIAHSPAKHVAAHQPERAKTLMRSVVKKPKIDKKPLIKTQAPAEVMPKPLGTIAPKLSVSQVNPNRLERAQETPKSTAIKKFTAPATRQVTPVSRPLVAAPVRRAVGTPSKPQSTHVVAQPAPKSHAHAAATPKRDIFEEALAHATSHEQPRPAATAKKQRHRRRLVNVMAAIAAFLLIGGFVAYLNAPNIELRIASVRAGFHASLPAYQPVGYAMNRGVSTHNKQVTVSFHSDNGTGFQLTQEPSNWDSATLYDNLVATTNKNHQTIESGGRTIYLFGDTNAAWVNAGVLYQIKGNAELSNNQISELAASM